VIPLLSRRTRYSWSYGHLIFFSRGYGGTNVCDAESLFSLFFLLYFSLIYFLHSICSLILPLLCRGSMYSLSYGYLNFFDGEGWRKGMWPQIITVTTFPPVFFINSFLVLYYFSNVTFSVLWEYVLFELWLFAFFWQRYVTQTGMWPRIITFTTYPPLFFIISSFTPYLLSNNTFIVLWEYILFELQLFENFQWRDVMQKVNDTESLLSLLLLLYFVLIHLLHHIRSLTIPLLWHASRYCWSYGYLREFSMECRYHVPHPSQLNTQSSGLSPHTPSLLENPLTFFTNTHHPSQRYHLSFSTKKDWIFSRNTVVNTDMAPCLPVRHILYFPMV
jgi:hypothetical protein